MDDALTRELTAFVDAQVAKGGYDSAREYLDALMLREREITHVRALLFEGRDSGPGEIVDDAYFDRLRQRIREKARRSA